MPSTVDGAQCTRLQVIRLPGTGGGVQVWAEIHLKSGQTVIQTKHADVTRSIGAQRLRQLAAAFDALAQDVVTQELA